MKILFLLCLVSILFLVSCSSIIDCKTDIECFKEKAKTCSKVKVNVNSEGNDVRITIRGISDNNCKVSLKIEELGQDIIQKYPTEAKIAIGKTMNCNIDTKYADAQNLNYIDEINNLTANLDKSCSGPLKDIIKGPIKDIVTEKFERIIT